MKDYHSKHKLRRFSKTKKTITATVISTALLLNLIPISTNSVISNLSNESSPTAHAVSLANVQLLSDVKIFADLTEQEENYDLELGMTGKGLADVELVGPERISVFYIPELAGKIQADGPADIRVELLPITIDEDLPALGTALGALTGTATDLVGGVVGALDKILGDNPLLKPFVSIEGLDEVNTAIDNLNTLDTAVIDLLAYEGEVDVVVNSNGSIVVDFSNGLGDHLDTAVNELVTGLVNDLLNAVGNLEIRVLDGVKYIPIVGPILVGVVNDLILGGIVSELLNGVTTGLQPVVAGVTAAATDITTQLAGLQVIGDTTINANVKVDRPAGVDGDATVFGAGVNTSVIDLTLLSSLTDQTTINFDEKTIELDPPGVPEKIPEEDTSITGTGVPGATAHVKDNQGNQLGEAPIDAEGNFEVEFNRSLVGDEKLEVTQSKRDDYGRLIESEPAHVTIQPGDPEPLELDAPDVDKPTEGEIVVTGTGEPGATVVVKDKNDEIGAAIVGKKGEFTVTVDRPLVVGEDLDVTQSKEDEHYGGIVESGPTTVTVQSAPLVLDPPEVVEPYEGQTVVTGTGDPGATVKVIDENGEIGTTTVDSEGDFTVDIGDRTLVEGEKLEVTQSKKDENYDKIVVSDPTTKIVQSSGELTFDSAPANLNFKVQVQSSPAEYLVDLDNLGNDLVVSDNRRDKDKWELRANMDNQLTDVDDPTNVLKDVLFYRLNGDKVNLTDDESVIKSHQYGDDPKIEKSFNLSSGPENTWGQDDNGMFIEIEPGVKKADYHGEVKWTLYDAP